MAFREVELGPLRDAFLRSGMTQSELARRLDYYRPDSQRAMRAIGLVDDPSREARFKRKRSTTSYERALAIAQAIGVDPHEVGL